MSIKIVLKNVDMYKKVLVNHSILSSLFYRSDSEVALNLGLINPVDANPIKIATDN